MDDVKPKRSLKEIFPTKPRRHKAAHKEVEEEPSTPYVFRGEGGNRTPIDFRNRGGVGKLLIFLFIVAALILGGFYISSSFSKAVVKITPKNQPLVVSGTYDAVTQGEGLHFYTISGVEDSEQKAVPASGSEQVSKKASGRLIIYNNFSSASQPLVKTTRFESPSGNIYRILENVTVPGQSKNEKGETVPGALEVLVEADKPGAEYNLGLSDFTIPGFKGSPKYDKFYARSKTPMEGGLVGQAPKISDADRQKVSEELKQTLVARVSQKLKAQAPDDVVLFPDSVVVRTEDSVSQSASGQATLTLKATASAILFKKSELAKFLAQRMMTDYKEGEEVDMANWQDLKFTLEDKEKMTQSFPPQIKFDLQGNGLLVWKFNQEELKNKLKNTDSETFKNVLFAFPVNLATISFKPPWIRTVPGDINRIEIDLQTPSKI